MSTVVALVAVAVTVAVFWTPLAFGVALTLTVRL